MTFSPFLAGNVCELSCANGEKYTIDVHKVSSEIYGDEVDVCIRGHIWHYFKPISYSPSFLKYKKVIYHNPATIVLWEDGTKTVVKCDPKDTYDPEKGLALCFMKKALGNKSRAINDILHKEEIKK